LFITNILFFSIFANIYFIFFRYFNLVKFFLYNFYIVCLKKVQNNFSYEYNQQRDFKMNYDYYPQQPYGFQQQPIVTPTIMLDISRLTMCELNDLYFRSFF